MKKLSKIIVILLLISVMLSTMFLLKKDEKVYDSNEKVKLNLISMMIEQEDGTYKQTNDENINFNKYVLNTKKSGCENGGSITWNEDNQKIESSLLTSDKCYVYFDIFDFIESCNAGKEDNLSCEIIKNKDNSLIYHDGLSDYDGQANVNLEAKDYSFRYSGGNPNNYLCLKNDETICSEDNLYRIIGLFKNEDNHYEIKVIKRIASSIVLGTNENLPNSAYKTERNEEFNYYYWNSANGITDGTGNGNMWQYSNLNNANLNGYFYSYLTDTLKINKNKIVKHKFITGGFSTIGNAYTTYQSELGENRETKIGSNACYNAGDTKTIRICQSDDVNFDAFIGLLYVSDFGYAAYPTAWNINLSSETEYSTSENKNNNWIIKDGNSHWTISRQSSSGHLVYDISYMGVVKNPYVDSSISGISAKPVFYLNSNVKKLSGTGSRDNPYRII